MHPVCQIGVRRRFAGEAQARAARVGFARAQRVRAQSAQTGGKLGLD
jgi:hypothetical protein